MSTEALLKRFPKKRVPLPPAQQRIYEEEYVSNRHGRDPASLLSRKLENWMHRKITRDTNGTRLLEIGGGTLNHLPWLKAEGIEYLDVVEPKEFLYQNSPLLPRVTTFYSDIGSADKKYDTIYSIAALEHITDLPAVVAKAGLLLAPGGVFLNGIPAEGGFLWGVSWRLSTGLAYKARTGFSYAAMMRHEHVNDYDEIVAIVQWFFENVTISFFPGVGKHTSLFAYLHAGSPRLARCEAYLDTL